MAQKKAAKNRVEDLDKSSPLQGLTPTDFCRDWPHGPVTLPRKLAHLPKEEARRLVQIVEDFRVLSKEYRNWTEALAYKQQKVADTLGLSNGTIGRVRGGTGFVSWRAFQLLRNEVPSELRLKAILRERDAQRRARESGNS